MPSLRAAVAVVVTAIWALSYVIGVIHPAFKPAPETTTVMLIVVTWLFAAEVRKRNGNGRNQ